jgi:N-acetylglucosamine-6-sulfatase
LPTSSGTVDLIERPNYVILKEPQRLKNLPFNVDASNNIRSRATSLEDPSHSLDAPAQDDISARIKSATCSQLTTPPWSKFRNPLKLFVRRIKRLACDDSEEDGSRMKSLISVGLLVSLVATARAVEPVPTAVEPVRNESAKPRNVVFVLADDHRYDAMSFLGHQFAQTPHMDTMARRGVYFKHAMVTTSLCSPSRASILTGLYTFRHRVIDNNRPVPPGTLFFPQYLQTAGYTTAFIGKWHMGHADDSPQPGFDHWVSFRGQGHYLPPGPKYTLNVNGTRVKQKGYITDELTDYAVGWLAQQTDRDTPFFLYLSHKAVHANFTPAKRHHGKFAELPFRRPATEANTSENYADKPRWLRDQRNSWHGVDFPYHSDLDVERYYKAYCETLCAVDDSLGRIMEQLGNMDILDETVVIYMGDNGFMFGEHGLIDKRVAYETSIRVPLLMQCPDLFAGNTVVNELVANIDIAPTVLEAMALEKPPHMDGESLIGLGRGKHSSWRDHLLYVYYWEKNYPQSPTVFALRGNQYKYITYYGLWDTDELYDVKNDPDETRNLVHDAEYAETAKSMQRELFAMMEELGGSEIPLNAPRGGSLNKRLRRRGGQRSSDFPSSMLLDEPPNR